MLYHKEKCSILHFAIPLSRNVLFGNAIMYRTVYVLMPALLFRSDFIVLCCCRLVCTQIRSYKYKHIGGTIFDARLNVMCLIWYNFTLFYKLAQFYVVSLISVRNELDWSCFLVKLEVWMVNQKRISRWSIMRRNSNVNYHAVYCNIPSRILTSFLEF